MDVETKIDLTEGEVLENLPFLASSEERPYDFGVLVGDEFLYWDDRYDRVSRVLRVVEKRVNWFIDFIVGLTAGFLLVLAVVSVFVLLPVETWNRIEFWMEPSLALLWFWGGLFFGLFFIYRRALSRKEPVETGDRDVHSVFTRYISWDGALALPRDKRISLGDRCSSEALAGFEDAAELAESFGHGSISLLHIFAGQLSRPSVGHIFARLGINFDQIKGSLGKKLRELPVVQSGVVGFDPLGQRTVLGAGVHARLHGRTVIMPADVFISAYRNSAFLRELFYDIGIEEDAMENVLAWLQIREELRARWQSFRKSAAFKPVGAVNRAYTSVATPLLDSVSADLTSMAVRGGLSMLIGRDDEMERIFRVFESGGRSCVIVGHSGVGKKAMIDGMAELMVKEDVPEMLQDKRFVSLDVARLVSGATPSQSKERLLTALGDVARSGNIALAVPDIHGLVGMASGGTQGLDLAGVLAAELEKGYFVMVATTTPEAYRQALEGTSLGNVLTKVDLDEPDRQDSIRILESKVGMVEARERVVFSYAAVEAIVELSSRYIHDQYLPEKAVRILDEVGLAVKQKRGVGTTVSKEDVAAVISVVSKVPLTSVTRDEKEKLLGLEDEMKKRVIGQDGAVDMVASALRRARTELRSGRRPIANFLFMGPTGVGKTELAKTIAGTYFGDEDAMIRLDMSEYQDKSSVHRMLGVPGSGEGGVFTEAVRARPFGLVLLDELEKAHPDILNLFLQVFDDGRLTDSVGRTVDFTQTIIVATSNAGSAYIQQEVKAGTDLDSIKSHLIEVELADVYRPEFLNRFDGVVVFKPLDLDSVVAVAKLMIAGVVARLEEKGIGLEVSDSAFQELAVAGYDPQFGARPLRRVIQEKVEDKLATILLKDEASRGDTVVLDAGGSIVVRKEKGI